MIPPPGSAAIRSDGGLVVLRGVCPDDRDQLRQLNAQASDRSIRSRFFAVNRAAADRYADTVAAAPDTAQRAAFVAVADGRILGLATLETLDATRAELAVLISDAVHSVGIGTLLLERLVTAARERGITELEAEVLAENVVMLNVLRDLGLPLHADPEAGEVHVTIDPRSAAGYAAAVTERERVAELENLRALRAPGSVAVVGVGANRSSVGRAVLGNLITGGYTGRLYVVHPRHRRICGVAAYPSCEQLPEPPDLVVVAVPAETVPAVLEQCGRRGARVVLLLSAGFGETGPAGAEHQLEVLATARRYGMRLVGPNCVGVVNTDPLVQLNATFTAMPMLTGRLGLVSQSGALGVAVINAASRRGLGLAEFVSVGNKADISSNDLLLAWQQDERVSVIALYLESFGNPRRFARIARAVARDKPLIALKSGRGAAGERAGLSHTAAAASAEPVVDALFAQTGVQRVNTMEQLIDAARIMDGQPLPQGHRIAIIGNSGGPGVLAADAAEAAGLQVVELPAPVRAAVRAAVPTVASDHNPVDLGSGVAPRQVQAAVAAVLAADDVDAVVTVFTPTRTAQAAHLRAAVVAAASTAPTPVVSVEVGGVGCTIPFATENRALPVFGFPESAVAALAVAVRCGQARADGGTADAESPSPGPDLGRARAICAGWLADGPRWLAPEEAAELLDCAGIPVAAQRVVADADAAVDAAAQLGYPVAVKVTHTVHRSDVGGVRLDLRDDAELRCAVAELRTIAPSGELLVQAMHPGGVEVIVGGLQDSQFGPVVLVGAGGVLTELSTARTVRLAPLSDTDAAAMLTDPALTRLLAGFRGLPPVSPAALAELVRRVGALVDQLPDVAELDLNPVICRGAELVVVDAKVRIAPHPRYVDPDSRALSGGGR
jgi:acyl-CoA synthetase (NDP forming)/GNAT superfamily N-acetyltransferase